VFDIPLAANHNPLVPVYTQYSDAPVGTLAAGVVVAVLHMQADVHVHSSARAVDGGLRQRSLLVSEEGEGEYLVAEGMQSRCGSGLEPVYYQHNSNSP
jgi:hypothetical protein